MPYKLLFCSVFLVSHVHVVMAQSTKKITIINSSDTAQQRDMTRRVQSNIRDLIKGKYKVVFVVKQGNNNQATLNKLITNAQNNRSTDVVITTGLTASQKLIGYKKYNKPSIAGFVINESLQGMPRSLAGKSGKYNFTYVKQNYNAAKDLQTFNQILPVDSFVLVIDSLFKKHDSLIRSAFKAATLKPFNIVYVNPENYAEKITGEIDTEKTKGFYVSPLASFSKDNVTNFFQFMQNKKLATFSMNGDEYTKLGALAGFSSSEYPEIRSRRIALDVLKILDGQSAKSLPVNLPQVETNFVINENTANAIGLSPRFDLLSEADLVNYPQSLVDTGIKVYDYQHALDTALEKNLAIKKKQKELEFSQTEIVEAKRAFLPSLDVNYTATKVDNKFRAVQGAGITQKLKASASQVIYSDEALSLYQARKLDVKANKQAIKQAEYQLIYDVMAGFVQHFHAKNQVFLLQENAKRTKTNLNIAKRKSNVGYSGKIDVYRLESEYKINQANLNKARIGLTQSELYLKKLLDLPFDSKVKFKDIDNPISLLSIGDATLLTKLHNRQQLNHFANYLTSIAFEKRPELKQLSYQLDSLQYLARAQKRKWYIPMVSLTANGNKEIARHDTIPERGKPTLSPNWDISLVASLPLFDRQQQTNNQKKSIQIEQLKVEQQDLVKSINLSINNDLQTAVASYSQIDLFKASANSAQKNFGLIENLYKHGQTPIASLIDAQNNVLNSKLKVINAEQQFFLDFLKVEKNAGFYFFRTDEEGKQAFLTGFDEFITQHTSAK